ncbi:glucan endo-1,3-beta-glucosidase 8-like [Curcuma longa]|uniref:glucan endo-1,3-beta-glucosidase 8-like n=1 Tax=Curcuma longa TaxID=136217 RepID=UPI003D9E40EE
MSDCRILLCVVVVLVGICSGWVDGLGVNWGTMASHPLPPKIVVQMLKANGISRVKIFDADAATMNALAGSGIEVMVAIPNNMLGYMIDYDTARQWVSRNVTRYNFQGGVKIKYVAVGNEPFLTTYNGSFLNITLPALRNVQAALDRAGVGDSIKATVPLNADVYNSPTTNPVPSAGLFRADIRELMTQIVSFLNYSGAPFTVNIYPFISLYENPNFPVDFAFFDGTSSPVVDSNGIQYNNVFDANFDTLVAALTAVGMGDLPIIVGEVGWPTDGDVNAKTAYAQRFYNGLLRKLSATQGTPRRPNQYVEVYMFSLIDEDAKSIAPGNFERHWGIFKYDGQPKFALDSGQGQEVLPVAARNVQYLPKRWCVFAAGGSGDLSKLGDNINYACSRSDCTALGYGSSCNGLDANGNASFAFNMYFQVQNQQAQSCNFQGLAAVTTQDPSTPECNFTIQIVANGVAASAVAPSDAVLVILLWLFTAIVEVF